MTRPTWQDTTPPPPAVAEYYRKQRRADIRDTLWIIAGGIAIGGLLFLVAAYY